MLEEALRKAIKLVGSQKKLAALLGVGCPVLNNWLNTGIKIPLKHALHIEVLTQGLVRAENLTPEAKAEIFIYQKYLFKKYFPQKGDL
jgi:DNA-binding transcriptional regulator YdaS (Cro superfamily)